MPERRNWSLVTKETMVGYLQEAQLLVELAQRRRIHPFAAAIAGVGFIRNALAGMGGMSEWWCTLITCPDLTKELLTPVDTTRGTVTRPPQGTQ